MNTGLTAAEHLAASFHRAGRAVAHPAARAVGALSPAVPGERLLGEGPHYLFPLIPG
ncbi:MAG: hypothetical protein WKH64_18545 [Chloroflexia bacterium]